MQTTGGSSSSPCAVSAWLKVVPSGEPGWHRPRWSRFHLLLRACAGLGLCVLWGAPLLRLRRINPLGVLPLGEAGYLGLWDGPVVPEPPQTGQREGSAAGSGGKAASQAQRAIPGTVPPAPGRHSQHRDPPGQHPLGGGAAGRPTAPGTPQAGTAPACAARDTPRPQVLAGR